MAFYYSNVLLVFFFLSGVAPIERLEYDIKYGPITLGSMVLEKLPLDTLNGRECQHLCAEVKLGGPFSFLFWGEYRLESWCDKDSMLTIRSYKRVREKNYRSEWSAQFESGRIIYTDGKTYPLSYSTRDLLTLWFYLRQINWKKGEKMTFNAHIDRRNWRISLLATERKKVKTPNGEFDCLVLYPQTTGPLGRVYLSSDEHRLPVVICTRINSFGITAYLRGYQGSHKKDKEGE